MSDRTWTVLEILNSARGYLAQKGVENPRGSADALLGKVLDLPRIELYVQHDRPLAAAQVDAFRELIRRRAQHEPLQLLLGVVEFLGVTLEVVPGLLIPRPETEELAAALVEILRGTTPRPRRMLDIGTGTGCLAVAVAKEIPEVTFDAVDVDFHAVRCATRNAELNGVGERVTARRADLFSPRFAADVQPPYDVLVSNPPYIAEADYAGLQAEVKDHEPRHALVAEHQGLAFYERIAELLPALLLPGGLMALEIGFGQSDAVRGLLQNQFESLVIKSDLSGVPRMVLGMNAQAEANS